MSVAGGWIMPTRTNVQTDVHIVPVDSNSPTASNRYVYKTMRYMSVDRTIGAGEGIRTLDPNLGKVVLYH